MGTLEYDYLRIHDVGNGGTKTDKFERDIRLLKQVLSKTPNNDRYTTFYLAYNYEDAGQPENAIEAVKTSIKQDARRYRTSKEYKGGKRTASV